MVDVISADEAVVAPDIAVDASFVVQKAVSCHYHQTNPDKIDRAVPHQLIALQIGYVFVFEENFQ